MLFLLAALAVFPMNSILAQGALLPPDVRFENGPKVGELVPDVTIVDDQGRPVSVRELAQGQYTVMTLGCLT
jgi:cytochrome oxidase Cu insertion factor (SCO1/SenC/PrrC family)